MTEQSSSKEFKMGDALFSSSGSNVHFTYSYGIFVAVFEKSGCTAGGVYYDATDGELFEKCSKILDRFKELGSGSRDIVVKVISSEIHYINKVQKFFADHGISITSLELDSLCNYEVKLDCSSKQIRFRKIIIQENSTHKKINVLIVDDSLTMRKVLHEMISSGDRIGEIYMAAGAQEAQQIIDATPPDVITLDINMPEMDGVTFLKQYMKVKPIPTIMVTAFNINESGHILEALENGAFDYIEKPSFQEIRSHQQELLFKLYSAHEATGKVGRTYVKSEKKMQIITKKDADNYLFLIGSSTGGTDALKVLLTSLPAEIPPILIVQHIPPVFSKAFAQRMNELCPFSVKEAENNDPVLEGQVLIAPGGRHMKYTERGGEGFVRLTDEEPVNRFRPSVDYMINSVVDSGTERSIIASILTGMGDDGAKALLRLKQRGGYVIAQDEESSVVFGMPRATIELNAHSLIAPLYDIGVTMINKMAKKEGRKAPL